MLSFPSTRGNDRRGNVTAARLFGYPLRPTRHRDSPPRGPAWSFEKSNAMYRPHRLVRRGANTELTVRPPVDQEQLRLEASPCEAPRETL